MLEEVLTNIDQYIQFLRVKRKHPYVKFHLHNGCEIFFLINGDVEYFVEKTIYPMDKGDLIVTNNYELHKPAFTTPDIYERITIAFDPNIAKLFKYPGLNLLDRFYNRKNGENNKLNLTKNSIVQLMELFNRYEKLTLLKEPDASLLKLTCFLEILMLICRSISQITNDNLTPSQLIPVLEYIDQNIEFDLSLESLEKQFFINRFHLIRLFKKHIGSTIHDYIVFKRISRAKELISQGVKISDACLACGFNDYSNFVKVFKKITGIKPSDFKANSHLIL